jgi:5-methylcytosine-specific restriction protein A
VLKDGKCSMCGKARGHERRHPLKGKLYGRKWRELSRAERAAKLWCVMCLAEGKSVPAEVIDHVVPHRYDVEAFWHGERQPLCSRHHNIKTARGE